MSTAIVGAGIAGLAAAHELARAGEDVVVFEQGDRVGGRIRTERRNGYVFDVGAFIYLGSYGETVETMHDVGLDDQLGRFDAYGAMPRGGELQFLDLRRPVRTMLGTRYLSARSKVKLVKLLTLLARHWKDLNYHDASGIARIDTDTVTTYCERELNQEILDYLAAVVVRGPWLCDPSYASVGQLLWTLKNFFKPYFYGLDDGMDALPRALARDRDVRLAREVANVIDHGDRVEVTYREDGTERTEQFEAAVVTVTADRALEIYPQMDGVQRSYFEQTEYVASVNTHLGLSRRPENPATYVMVSPRENEHLSGVIVDHLKARGRVPEGKGMLTVFCDHEWCLDHLDAGDDVVLDEVLRFLAPYYGDLAPTLEDHEIGRWRQVVPVMRQGRFKAADAYLRSIDPAARVQFAGDLCAAIPGVNAALVSGRAAARRIASQTAERRTEALHVGG